MKNLKTLTSNEKLAIILWMVAIHSILVVISLIITPSYVFEYL